MGKEADMSGFTAETKKNKQMKSPLHCVAVRPHCSSESCSFPAASNATLKQHLHRVRETAWGSMKPGCGWTNPPLSHVALNRFPRLCDPLLSYHTMWTGMISKSHCKDEIRRSASQEHLRCFNRSVHCRRFQGMWRGLDRRIWS